MKKDKGINLTDRDVRAFIKDLTLLVVSIDRLGSAYYNDPQRLAVEKDRFLREVQFFKILAKMRSILSKAYESQRGTAEMRRLEARLENVKVWVEDKPT